MPKKLEKCQQRLRNLESFQKENQAQGRTLDHRTKTFRMKVVGMCAKANIAFNAMDDIQDDLEEIAGDGLRIGGRRGLTDLVQPMLEVDILPGKLSIRVNLAHSQDC